MTAAYLQKRSMRISGHRTSLALEPEFWSVAEMLAQAEHTTLPKLFAEIDATKKPAQSLASAVRCAAIAHLSRQQMRSAA